MRPRDITLFVKSGRTDAWIIQTRDARGARAAFEAAYERDDDPWCAESTRYRYQALKYDKLVGLLPTRHFARALDLGCGSGLLSCKLSDRAEQVLGIDLSSRAIERARARSTGANNLTFEQGDILSLPDPYRGCFDLVVVADVLYYLSPLDDATLQGLVQTVASLLRPGGVCLVANHYFCIADPESRVSRRIHRAFVASPMLAILSQHRRFFFLASVLTRLDAEAHRAGTSLTSTSLT